MSPASIWRRSKVRGISKCGEASTSAAREGDRFSAADAGMRASVQTGSTSLTSLPRIGSLAGTLATDGPKSARAGGRRSAMTVAGPLRPEGRLGGFDDRAHPARILPPAYQDAGLGSPRQQTAEQDYGREHSGRPPTIHGCSYPAIVAQGRSRAPRAPSRPPRRQQQDERSPPHVGHGASWLGFVASVTNDPAGGGPHSVGLHTLTGGCAIALLRTRVVRSRPGIEVMRQTLD